MREKLAFSQVSFSYGDQPILDRFGLEIQKGELVSLIGPSGIGKSTLFQLAAGLLQPEHGVIRLDGQPATKRLGQVGYMPQRDLLLAWRTVAENAGLPLEIQGFSQRAIRERVEQELPRFGLAEWKDAYPEELSGGMRQRVSFMRALLTGADLLLLDEPFSALDGITRMEMQEWLHSMWQQTGSTMLLITHDIDEAILLADRVVVLLGAPIRQPVELRVAVPRPRSMSSRNDPAFHALREEIWQLLRSSAHAVGERRGG
ncbi:ABC transporter ATP-binding protein [Brevibacillus ruminantium]|uniref:ABC transporter ATP-binding protein n=1 Tax=Brevibacillus ruminantium TaxID=2950604 RepID=A0ABY4WM16_9BACL|nr:ABC transporter ATP-binding protein [Brevibacillus ruminantium]USG68205.1 ABC transporter ATP-binding protein [Brevibacillus ruminantium]